VINLESLANNFEYLEKQLLPNHFLEYFRQQGATCCLARDIHLSDRKSVEEGSYLDTRFARDRRIRFRKGQEIFRYAIPENISVFSFQTVIGA